MRIVLAAAEASGAQRLLDITSAHVDSCLYHGEASIDFVERLVGGDARVSVPTTLNVGGADLLHPDLFRGDQHVAERSRVLMDRYRALGARPTFTCAPYQLAEARPGLGEHVAWGESNAIAFCNSVLGARTNRYGDFLDIAAAICGRVPESGLHLDEARHPSMVLRLADDVPPPLRDDDSLYPILGIVLGRRAGSSVAALDGLPPRLSEERLKALAASSASSGAVGMFHVIGSTPEADLVRGDEPVELVTLAELRAVRDALSPAAGMPLGAVSLGTPHASRSELETYAAILAGRTVAPSVECLVSTGRDTLADAPEAAERLAAAGVEILTDTCSYVAPVLRRTSDAVMTDSGKWAYYAPGNIGARVVIGSTRDCLESAIAGGVVRDDGSWGGA